MNSWLMPRSSLVCGVECPSCRAAAARRAPSTRCRHAPRNRARRRPRHTLDRLLRRRSYGWPASGTPPGMADHLSGRPGGFYGPSAAVGGLDDRIAISPTRDPEPRQCYPQDRDELTVSAAREPLTSLVLLPRATGDQTAVALSCASIKPATSCPQDTVTPGMTSTIRAVSQRRLPLFSPWSGACFLRYLRIA